ncbi:hypothetical protein HPB49_019568 [Dermacentor silvarum]|uniref:Uncharacterized protein n=1 Tax=Dermacentor silvarum TaxID=543639 RepID=A0ACB8CZG5_DERSI|nr:hypothetical protein HPB49_019568 [Dermacentor silvarum]
MLHACPRCPFSAAKLSTIVWHLRDHRHEYNFSVTCGVKGCPATYRNFESYRKHLYRQHRNYMELGSAAQVQNIEGTFDSAQSSEQPTDVAPGHCDGSSAGATANGDSDVLQDTFDNVESFSDDAPITDTEEDGRFSSGTNKTTDDFKQQVKKQLCLLFFRIAEVHKLPHSTTEEIFSDFKVTFMDMLRLLAEKIKYHVAAGPEENTEIDRLLSPEFFDDVFEGASSKYQREQFARNHLCYVKPEEHALRDGTTFQYVPIISVLQNLMMSENFCNSLDHSISTQQESAMLRNFCDGLMYKEKISAILQNGSQYTLFLVLYSDEIDIVNPLGSKRGIHKLLVVYFSVLNLHACYRSQLCTIHVAVIARYKIVVEHGIEAVLEPLLRDVSALQKTGFISRQGAATTQHCLYEELVQAASAREGELLARQHGRPTRSATRHRGHDPSRRLCRTLSRGSPELRTPDQGHLVPLGSNARSPQEQHRPAQPGPHLSSGRNTGSPWDTPVSSRLVW